MRTTIDNVFTEQTMTKLFIEFSIESFLNIIWVIEERTKKNINLLVEIRILLFERQKLLQEIQKLPLK